MTEFTNVYNIDLSMAVWLVADDYDFVPKEHSISTTALMKPLRQIILGGRVTEEQTEDLSGRIAMRRGHAFHDSIEQAWKKSYAQNMKLLGMPQSVIDRVKINPDMADVTEDTIPVWLEQRGTRQIGKWTVSGKFDMSLNYRAKDFKSTSVFTYIKGSKDEDYRLQMSMYRLIAPEKIKEDEGDIQFIFTDWQKSMVNSVAGYPQIPLLTYPVPLYSEEEILTWAEAKLDDIEHYKDLPQEDLPRCTDQELWRTDPVWKYYSDPTKTDGRATKNFSDAAEANAFRDSKGKGIVVMVPGKVKACMYCRAFPICEQRKEYEFDE